MAMMQEDIKSHYREKWGALTSSAKSTSDLETSNPIEDPVTYAVYEQAIRDHAMRVDGGSVLDVGSGPGRWVRFFLERFTPKLVAALDATAESIALLRQWHPPTDATQTDFRVADVTDPSLPIDRAYDVVNVSRVLFHIPEVDLFRNALRNLARLVHPDGFILTTEYLPRCTMRTNFMLVHSRYAFEQFVRQAGLRIVDVRAYCFFAADPMGLDGPDDGLRAQFWAIQKGMRDVLAGATQPAARKFWVEFFSAIERATIDFCRERIAEIDLPSQKLVILARA